MAAFGEASLRVDGGGVDQHDGDIVLDWVDAAADAAFQAGAGLIHDHRLSADRANQHIKQILGDHGAYIVA